MMALKTTPEKDNHKKENSNQANSKLKHKIKKDINKALQSLQVDRKRFENYLTVVMSACYPYQYYNCPIGFTECNPIVPVNPLYAAPMPIVVNPPIVSTPICPYIAPVVIPSIIASVPGSSHTSPISSYHESISEFESPSNGTECVLEAEDPIEYYLSLPKDLFPSARNIILDPNELIEAFCRLSDVYSHLAWILDLEFGIPKSPITRPIPYYNVKFNSIHCKNTPDAIHPGFESCDEDFKRVFLFYYDFIVSAWYRSYVFLNGDKSVENFQAWLMLPMQELGMCWSYRVGLF